MGFPSGDKYCFTIEFKDTENVVHGLRAGLAFCLHFAFQVWSKPPNDSMSPGFSIAATGVISDAKGSAVTRVEGIGRKLARALDVLQQGDKIFYPHDNDGEIDAGIRDAASTKGIALIPVATVREALAELFRIRQQDKEAPLEKAAVKISHETPRLYGLPPYSRIPRPVILVSSILIPFLLLAGIPSLSPLS